MGTGTVSYVTFLQRKRRMFETILNLNILKVQFFRATCVQRFVLPEMPFLCIF